MIKQEIGFNYRSNSDRPNEKIDDSGDCLRKMFIGGLSPMTTEESLCSFYSQWGDVVDAVVMRDLTTKRSRGFGFITYADSSMVDRAQAARPHLIDGKTVDPKRALPRGESTKTESSTEHKKIFVGGLKDNHDEQSLKDHFSQFGNVISVKILTDKATGRKRGFAFVEFDDYDAVDKAILCKNHTIKYVMVDVKKSMYKQEQAKKFHTQTQSPLMVPVNVPPANIAASGYLPTGHYNANVPYGYSSQLPPTQNHYNWNSYNANPYQQPQAYGYAVNGQGNWPAYGNQQWDQNVIQTSQPVVPTPGASGWEPTSPKSFGNYQQVFNGGPQKNGNLQANRVNPYNGGPIPNYGM